MSTTPPTKQCPFKVGDKIVAVGNYEDEQLGDYAYRGVQTVLAIVDVRHLDGTSGWWLKTDHKDRVDAAWFRLALSGAGKVAAEADLRSEMAKEDDYLNADEFGEPLAPTPSAATDDDQADYYDASTPKKIIEELRFMMVGARPADIREAEAQAIVDLEAAYAARFERAIGEDGDNWPDSEVNGEEDFRQALAEESQNKLRAEARSRYYGEQAGEKR